MEILKKKQYRILPNYDGSEFIPECFTYRIPNLLVNGSSGAITIKIQPMATNIPPHNLTEVLNHKTLTNQLNPKLSIDDLIKDISGRIFQRIGTIDEAGIY